MVFGPHSRVGEHDKDLEGTPVPDVGQGSPERFTSRLLIQPIGYKSNSLSNSLHVAVPTIPDGLPDLVGHVDHLRTRADAAIPAMNDHLTGLGRHFQASNFLHRYRPRQSRPCDGGQSDGGGGCIACDRNEEECFALAAISRRTVPNGRKKDASGVVIDGEGVWLTG
jgi:hypothetical protein